jgi:ribosomal protein S18 acetylase RimI-like enzyme
LRSSPVRILRAAEATEELLEGVRALAAQLDRAAEMPSLAHLGELIRSGSTELLLAEGAGGKLLGMLTLAWYPIPTGARFWIEDVVVDSSARGAGVGEALVRAGLQRARERGASRVDLTSRPEREAANRLYVRVGFERRETNAYRYSFRARDPRHGGGLEPEPL